MSLSEFGLIEVAAVTPELRVADVEFNTARVIDALAACAGEGCRLVLFPELGLTGYTCADLQYQSLLLQKAREALQTIAEATETHGLTAVVGLPLAEAGKLYNCAAVLSGGALLGLVPKSYIVTTNEYYEKRWFTSAFDRTVDSVNINGREVEFGEDLLFRAENLPGCVIGIEICEDLWAVEPPSGQMAMAGATVLLNLSASNETLGKAEYRRDLVRQQSARCLAAYLYAAAGPGESSTDVVYSGHSMIAENGLLLAETERFRFETSFVTSTIDVERLAQERIRNSSFSASRPSKAFRVADFKLPEPVMPSAWQPALHRPLSRTPFVPSDRRETAAHCREIFAIQSTGLAKRLKHTDVNQITIGISGGLDSTLALLVTIKAFDTLELDHSGIIAVNMPGFGTTARTRSNAERLAQLLGVTLRTISIDAAVRQHFDDIDHDETTHNVVYENSQARERTQILMDIANQVGGIVVGTGDLSELALGWCTYNGDHMSMYNVNCSIPKTLVKHLVSWCADEEFSGEVSNVLHDICAMPITPELLPLDEQGGLTQETESSIGPYELHDFFLFHTVRHPFSPRKVFFLAGHAFGSDYSASELLEWLGVFYRRFCAAQFKRSAIPDGPKVGSVALSPRGDWRMPSDASSALWMHEVEKLTELYARPPVGARVRSDASTTP
ncbi:MAG: NAD(+) synthase [Planctomycetaceae bacterium]